jgi:RNA polymerase sigma-70 factor, ECF subfamily
MNRDLVPLLPRLRRYARVLTGKLRQADQLVLDTLACARGRPDPGEPGTLSTRLIATMRELHVGQAARPSRTLDSTPPALDDDGSHRWRILVKDVQSGRTEMTGTLGHFSRLPVGQREVLVLVAVEGLPYDEIATLLGVPIATVMARLNSARESMRSMAVESSSRSAIAK